MFREITSSVLGSIQNVVDTKTHTSSPITTGTTVLGLKYADGVMLASDTLASYGSLARYKDVRRLQKIGTSTIIGGSGEISDFQSILEDLNSMNQNDINQDDGYTRYYIYIRYFF
jgi:20S proteasome subunit beta 7